MFAFSTQHVQQRAYAGLEAPGLQVLVDVNWRPVFWDNQETAPERIKEYVDKADILKLSDDEAEFIYGVAHRTSLENPETVCCPSTDTCSPWRLVCACGSVQSCEIWSVAIAELQAEIKRRDKKKDELVREAAAQVFMFDCILPAI